MQPELPGAALALLPVGTEPSSVLNSPFVGWNKSQRIPGRTKPGPSRPGMRVGPVRSAMSGASQPRGPTLLLPAARGAPAKRLLDADDAAAVAAKCPRLSECSSPPDYLSPPGSPCSPQPPPAAPGSGDGSGSSPGPSRIADYLLLPLTEREHVSRALCIHTGRELRCKVGSRGLEGRGWRWVGDSVAGYGARGLVCRRLGARSCHQRLSLGSGR